MWFLSRSDSFHLINSLLSSLAFSGLCFNNTHDWLKGCRAKPLHRNTSPLWASYLFLNFLFFYRSLGSGLFLGPETCYFRSLACQVSYRCAVIYRYPISLEEEQLVTRSQSFALPLGALHMYCSSFKNVLLAAIASAENKFSGRNCPVYSWTLLKSLLLKTKEKIMAWLIKKKITLSLSELMIRFVSCFVQCRGKLWSNIV